MLKSGLEQSKDITRLEYKVFSLERLYPSSPVEVSKSQTNIGSKKNLGPKRFGVHKNFGSKKNFGPTKIVCQT